MLRFSKPLLSAQRQTLSSKQTFGLLRFYTSSHVEKCPEPSYDTGCTYCMPTDMSLFSERRNPNGTSPFSDKIVLLPTGTPADQWPSKVEFSPIGLPNQAQPPASFTSDFTRLRRKVLADDFPVSFIHTDASPSPSVSAQDGAASLILFPDNVYFPRVDADKAKDFMQAHLLPNSTGTSDSGVTFESQPAKTSHVLICGHAQRDARCGMMGPLLVDEFKKVLGDHSLLAENGEHGQETDLEDKWQVSLCSHIGGHVVSSEPILTIQRLKLTSTLDNYLVRWKRNNPKERNHWRLVRQRCPKPRSRNRPKVCA